MDKICEKQKCTGCFSCVNACPFNAIEMTTDELGFIYPKINSEKCKDCGLCKKKCPQLQELQRQYPQTAYAMYSKDKMVRSESTSGGIAAILYEYIIETGGIVYGVSSEIKNNEIEFIRVNNKKQLYKLKGSKYVHAYIKNIFLSIKDDLKDDKKVLFIGTPCQVAGLKAFLNKDYNNLYIVDIICHGVPSQQLLFDELKYNELSNIEKVTFRNDKGYNITCFSNEKEVFNMPCRKNNYYRKFLSGCISRKSCYTCKYASIERIADITIGDFWGLNDNCKIKDDENKGISLVMPVTKKGEELLEKIKNKVILEERNIEEARQGNDQLKGPTKNIEKRLKFEKNYIKNGYSTAMKSITTAKDKIKACDIIYLNYKKLKEKIK